MRPLVRVIGVAVIVGFALALGGCSGSTWEDADGILCGPRDVEPWAEAGIHIANGPRKVRFVYDSSVSPEMKQEWAGAVESWRVAVESSCPFVPEFVDGHTSSVLTYTGDTLESPPPDTVELRSDDLQPDDKQGNGWSWTQCHSGRATTLSHPSNAHRSTRHELGHALGALPHDTSGAPALMSIEGQFWKVQDVLPADVEAYSRIWCPKVLTSQVLR